MSLVFNNSITNGELIIQNSTNNENDSIDKEKEKSNLFENPFSKETLSSICIIDNETKMKYFPKIALIYADEELQTNSLDLACLTFSLENDKNLLEQQQHNKSETQTKKISINLQDYNTTQNQTQTRTQTQTCNNHKNNNISQLTYLEPLIEVNITKTGEVGLINPISNLIDINSFAKFNDNQLEINCAIKDDAKVLLNYHSTINIDFNWEWIDQQFKSRNQVISDILNQSKKQNLFTNCSNSNENTIENLKNLITELKSLVTNQNQSNSTNSTISSNQKKNLDSEDGWEVLAD
eukprot:TRINITY_DN316_c1_g1_i1.p1 TRINITY_DN316_c1_g1~~TRINITY_DN316_c1_g1_i1.p1  ORF type:complete len:294 (-),score=129.35 TRINITY_DN316_c1_g1_i1:37-918(-)